MKNLIKVSLSLLVISFAASAASAADFPDMTVDQLEQAIADNSVVVIDANGSARYAKGHIPGAIDFSSVKDLSSVLPKDKEALIVAYCGGPKCSAYMEPAGIAKSLGYSNVKHLSAGISGWRSAGKAVAKGSAN